jgi:hypothetical protein
MESFPSTDVKSLERAAALVRARNPLMPFWPD